MREDAKINSEEKYNRFQGCFGGTSWGCIRECNHGSEREKVVLDWLIGWERLGSDTLCYIL